MLVNDPTQKNIVGSISNYKKLQKETKESVTIPHSKLMNDLNLLSVLYGNALHRGSLKLYNNAFPNKNFETNVETFPF